MSYLTRFYQPGDEGEIAELLRSTFTQWSESSDALDNWKWRYLGCPIKSCVTVTEYGGHVVGVHHSFHTYIKIGGESVLSALLGNLAVHPDHRGKGLYNKMLELIYTVQREKNIRLNMWSSSNPIIIDQNRRMGYSVFPHRISYMIRIRDVESYLEAKKSENAVAKKYAYTLLLAVNRITNAFDTHRSKNIGDVIIQDVSIFTPAMDAFWRDVREHFNYVFERSSLYLNWRYFDARSGKFVVKQAVTGSKVLGYVALELRERGGLREGYIVDLLASPGRSDVADALMEEACDYFDQVDAMAIHFWGVKNGLYGGIAKRYGFIDSKVRLYFGCNFKGETGLLSALESSPSNRIHFMLGDIDRF